MSLSLLNLSVPGTATATDMATPGHSPPDMDTPMKDTVHTDTEDTEDTAHTDTEDTAHTEHTAAMDTPTEDTDTAVSMVDTARTEAMDTPTVDTAVTDTDTVDSATATL